MRQLWTGKDEARWLGWLGVTNDQVAHIERLTPSPRWPGALACPTSSCGAWGIEPRVVMKMTFGKITGFPELHVLDSTDPARR